MMNVLCADTFSLTSISNIFFLEPDHRAKSCLAASSLPLKEISSSCVNHRGLSTSTTCRRLVEGKQEKFVFAENDHFQLNPFPGLSVQWTSSVQVIWNVVCWSLKREILSVQHNGLKSIIFARVWMGLSLQTAADWRSITGPGPQQSQSIIYSHGKKGK